VEDPMARESAIPWRSAALVGSLPLLPKSHSALAQSTAERPRATGTEDFRHGTQNASRHYTACHDVRE
jgi:hypothetical protein